MLNILPLDFGEQPNKPEYFPCIAEILTLIPRVSKTVYKQHFTEVALNSLFVVLPEAMRRRSPEAEKQKDRREVWVWHHPGLIMA